MLSIELLGGWAVRSNGQHVQADLGASGRRLCAYLAHHAGKFHRRDKLAEMFWPNVDSSRARAALNTALWRLRRFIAAEVRSKGASNIVARGDDIAFELASWLEIDSSAFDVMARDILRKSPVNLARDAMEQLKSTVACYSGPFLDGDDDDWILVERERLHSLFVRTAHVLAREQTRRDQFDDAIETLRGILAMDPFRESTHRDLLVLLLLNEQRAEALRVHQRWSVAIARELGIRPMAQTEALMSMIRANHTSEWLGPAREAYLNGRLVPVG